MKTSLKAGFAQIFSCCPKNLSCPKFGGAAAPLAPPGLFAYELELCMETPYWCTVLMHQYGLLKSTKTSGVHFFYKSSFFSLEN